MTMAIMIIRQKTDRRVDRNMYARSNVDDVWGVYALDPINGVSRVELLADETNDGAPSVFGDDESPLYRRNASSSSMRNNLSVT